MRKCKKLKKARKKQAYFDKIYAENQSAYKKAKSWQSYQNIAWFDNYIFECNSNAIMYSCLNKNKTINAKSFKHNVN